MGCILAPMFPTSSRRLWLVNSPQEREQRQAGRLPGPAYSCGKQEPELVLVYLHQLLINAPVQCHLQSGGLAGFVFHQQYRKTCVQWARGGGVTVIPAGEDVKSVDPNVVSGRHSSGWALHIKTRGSCEVPPKLRKYHYAVELLHAKRDFSQRKRLPSSCILLLRVVTGCCSDSCRSAPPRWLPLISVLKTGGKSVTTVSRYQLPKFCECSSYGWRNTDSWIIPETQYQLLNQGSPDRQHLPTSFVVSWQKYNSRWWSVTFIMRSEGGFCNRWVRREHPL